MKRLSVEDIRIIAQGSVSFPSSRGTPLRTLAQCDASGEASQEIVTGRKRSPICDVTSAELIFRLSGVGVYFLTDRRCPSTARAF